MREELGFKHGQEEFIAVTRREIRVLRCKLRPTGRLDGVKTRLFSVSFLLSGRSRSERK
jgi:hypothetical protein